MSRRHRSSRSRGLLVVLRRLTVIRRGFARGVLVRLRALRMVHELVPGGFEESLTLAVGRGTRLRCGAVRWSA